MFVSYIYKDGQGMVINESADAQTHQHMHNIIFHSTLSIDVLLWKFMNFDLYFAEVCFQGSN